MAIDRACVAKSGRITHDEMNFILFEDCGFCEGVDCRLQCWMDLVEICRDIVVKVEWGKDINIGENVPIVLLNRVVTFFVCKPGSRIAYC